MSWRLFSTLLLPLLFTLTGWAAEPPPSVDRAFVLGEVKRPGAVELTENGMTVYDVVACCGGLTQLANGTSVRLIHHLPDHKQIVIMINFDRLSGASGTASTTFSNATESALDPVVQPGDVIVVSLATSQPQ
jgi:protein involved in polysaccharide export with SLBB domain